MDASQLQSAVNELLIKHGLRDASGKSGLECTSNNLRSDLGLPTLAISSIALGKVKPFTEWFMTGGLITITVERGAQARPHVSRWNDHIPFDFMPVKSVDRRGYKYTLDLLDEAFQTLSQKLDRQLRNMNAAATLPRRIALIDFYFGAGEKLLVRGDSYSNSEAMKWIAAGVSSEMIVYCFADPFNWSTLVRKHRGPVVSLAVALELADVPLRRIALLYPLEELAA